MDIINLRNLYINKINKSIKKLDKQFALINDFDHHFIDQTGGTQNDESEESNECKEIEHAKEQIITRINNIKFPTIDFNIIDEKITEIRNHIKTLKTKETTNKHTINENERKITTLQEEINKLTMLKKEAKGNCNDTCKRALEEIDEKIKTMENEHREDATKIENSIKKKIQTIDTDSNSNYTQPDGENGENGDNNS